MQTLNFSTIINAPREKVWKIMLEDETYREWTHVFHPGSRYEGSWEKGSEIRFLGPSEEGKDSGMISEIAENIPNEFISIKHLGEIREGVENMYEGQEPAFENYTFSDAEGGTKLEIDLTGIPDEYSSMFSEMWPKALEKLKEMCER